MNLKEGCVEVIVGFEARLRGGDKGSGIENMSGVKGWGAKQENVDVYND